MTQGKAAEAARLLIEAWGADEPLASLPADCTPADEAEATAIGDAIIAAADFEIAGWKIGATAAGAQKALGLSGPFVGAIRQDCVVQSPARFVFADLNRPIIESEYAYRLAKDLPASGAPYDRAAVEAAIGAIIIGIELPLSRLGPDHGMGALASIADHGATGYYVIGREIADWRSVDAVNTEVALTFDGAEAGRGTGAPMMGDPVNALVWFANEMAGKGVGLKAGQFVSTGSCTGVIPAPCPVAAVADFGPDGKVEVLLA